MNVDFKEIAVRGIWRQNTGLVQLLGLCPILAVSNELVNGVSLALATVLVMTLSSATVAALRGFIPHEIRIPVFMLIIATLVTVLEMAMHAWLHALHQVLGIFLPLIVTNCIVLARVEAFAAKNGPVAAAWDGAMMGVGLVLVLAVLGGARELLGAGTLFNGIERILPAAQPWRVLPDAYPGFLLAILPPGAFILLGVLIAARNAIVMRRTSQAAGVPAAA
ncbi:MAG: electron transport complex subunit E [Betaproteobacteria bacterium]|nr:Electron transport complex subunit RnfE [Rhodocyclaceae bacterium]